MKYYRLSGYPRLLMAPDRHCSYQLHAANIPAIGGLAYTRDRRSIGRTSTREPLLGTQYNDNNQQFRIHIESETQFQDVFGRTQARFVWKSNLSRKLPLSQIQVLGKASTNNKSSPM